MNKVKSTEDKAERLVKGGVIKVEGIPFALMHEKGLFDPCCMCEMNSLCDYHEEICDICMECDYITNEDCYLILKKSPSLRGR